MSNISKICLLIAAISALIMGAVYFILQAWLPILYFFLITLIACLGVAVLIDWKLYLEFFTLKTTKHGMNMGVLIVLFLTGLVCVNYLGARHNKTWDLTSEKLYSLSEQTKKLISGLKEDVEIKVFYKGPNALVEKSQVQKVLDLYKDFSNKVKIRYLNSYVDKGEALEYLAPLSDRDSAKTFSFVEYDGKKIRVDSPFDENQFTRAIVKATRRGEKKVYFLRGHGERDLDSETPDGLHNFKEALEGQAFKVEPLNLLEKNEIPKDAEFLVIAGPKTAYLPQELNRLRDYATSGGRLLITVDPGERQNLAGFLRSYGVDFMNNYVVSLNRGSYTALAVAIQFSPNSKVTEDFHSGQNNVYAVFDMASELRPSTTVPNGIKVQPIVQSAPQSFALNDIKEKIREIDVSKLQTFTLGMEIKGRLDHNPDGSATETSDASQKEKIFEAVVFGDSDFISNQSIFLGVNRDLALNAAADLAHETDLIGTHAKSYKGTILDLGRYEEASILLSGMGLPIFLFIIAIMMWFRRRGA